MCFGDGLLPCTAASAALRPEPAALEARHPSRQSTAAASFRFARPTCREAACSTWWPAPDVAGMSGLPCTQNCAPHPTPSSSLAEQGLGLAAQETKQKQGMSSKLKTRGRTQILIAANQILAVPRPGSACTHAIRPEHPPRAVEGMAREIDRTGICCAGCTGSMLKTWMCVGACTLPQHFLGKVKGWCRAAHQFRQHNVCRIKVCVSTVD